MSTSIRGVVEYADILGDIKWDLGEVYFPSSMTNIQEYLGMHGSKKRLVPLRGRPEEGHGRKGTSSGYDALFTALVLRGKQAADVAFDEHGTYQEADGLCITEETAERWLAIKSGNAVWLDEWHGDFRRISDPDMQDVNWIKSFEYRVVLERLLENHPGINTLGPHFATLAAMETLEQLGHEEVRFVYGGS